MYVFVVCLLIVAASGINRLCLRLVDICKLFNYMFSQRCQQDYRWAWCFNRRISLPAVSIAIHATYLRRFSFKWKLRHYRSSLYLRVFFSDLLIHFVWIHNLILDEKQQIYFFALEQILETVVEFICTSKHLFNTLSILQKLLIMIFLFWGYLCQSNLLQKFNQ